MREARLGHRLEYAGFRILRFLATRLPAPLAYGMGAVLGWLAGSVLRIRRRVVDGNLARAFPHESRGWRDRVARASYRHLGVEAVAILRLARTDSEELARRCGIPVASLEEALARGRGALLLTGHVGNWELGAAALSARGIPVYVVARPQSNPLFDDDLNRTREGLGLRVIWEADATSRVVEQLRAGNVVAMAADQNVRKGGVFVDFFGVAAATARGPALFALRSGAPVFVGAVLRERGRRGWYRGFVEPLEVERTGRTSDRVKWIAQVYSTALEGVVREAPGQYFWQHQRWKTRPPGEEG